MHKIGDRFDGSFYNAKKYLKPASSDSKSKQNSKQERPASGHSGVPHRRHSRSTCEEPRPPSARYRRRSWSSPQDGPVAGYCARAQRAVEKAPSNRQAMRATDDARDSDVAGESPKQHMPLGSSGRRPKKTEKRRERLGSAKEQASHRADAPRSRAKIDALRTEIAAEIADFAAQIGIDPRREPDLMYIAEEFYSEPLPKGWREFWADDSKGNRVYYAMGKHTQWEHPMEHFYRALVYLHRTGFQVMAEEQAANPAEPQEIEEMAEYLGVNLKEEANMTDLVKMAVAAPLPPGWREDSSRTKFIHESGKVSENHPLDVYFLELIRVRRAEKERLVKEGKEGVARAQRAVLQMILKAEGNNWKILGLTPGSSKKEIRSQYRALALQVHPDKNEQEGAQKAFQLLGAAFRELMSNC